MRMFVLGTGAIGGLLAHILRRRCHVAICGDRDVHHARPSIGQQIECRTVNAWDYRSVIEAAQGCVRVINCVPAVFKEAALRAAIRLRAHYLDMATHLDRTPFKAEQLRFHEQFAHGIRLALVDAGATPGSTNLQVARCAEMFGVLYPFFGILLNLIIARATLSFSSVSVVANALRLRKTKL